MFKTLHVHLAATLVSPVACLNWISHNPATRIGGRQRLRLVTPLTVGVWRSFAHAFTHDIVERRRGIEPLSGDWKSLILPLNYRRDNPDVTLT